MTAPYAIRIVGPAGYVRYLRLVETDDPTEATRIADHVDALQLSIAYDHVGPGKFVSDVVNMDDPEAGVPDGT